MRVSFFAEEVDSGDQSSSDVSNGSEGEEPKEGRQKLFLKEDSCQISVEQGYFYLTTEYLLVILMVKL